MAEDTVHAVTGDAGLVAYRAPEGVINAAENIFKGKKDSFEQAKKDFGRTVVDLHNGNWRQGMSDVGSTIGDVESAALTAELRAPPLVQHPTLKRVSGHNSASFLEGEPIFASTSEPYGYRPYMSGVQAPQLCRHGFCADPSGYFRLSIAAERSKVPPAQWRIFYEPTSSVVARADFCSIAVFDWPTHRVGVR